MGMVWTRTEGNAFYEVKRYIKKKKKKKIRAPGSCNSLHYTHRVTSAKTDILVITCVFAKELFHTRQYLESEILSYLLIQRVIKVAGRFHIDDSRIKKATKKIIIIRKKKCH